MNISERVMVAEGDAAELECHIDGWPLSPRSVHWRRVSTLAGDENARVIDSNHSGALVRSQTTADGRRSVLRIAKVTRDTSGHYECMAHNALAPPAVGEFFKSNTHPNRPIRLL